MKQIVNNFSTQRCKKWKGNEKKTLMSANKIKVMSQNFLLYIWTSFGKSHWPDGSWIHSILTALSLSLDLTPGIQQRTLIVDRQFLIVVTNPAQKPMQSPRSLLESLSTHMRSILYCKPSNNSAQLYQNPILGDCSSDLRTLQKLHRCLKLECRIWLLLAVYKRPHESFNFLWSFGWWYLVINQKPLEIECSFHHTFKLCIEFAGLGLEFFLHCFWDILTVPWCVHPLTQCTLLSAQD